MSGHPGSGVQGNLAKGSPVATTSHDWFVTSTSSTTPWLHAEEREPQQRVNPHFHKVAPRIPGLEFMARIADLYLETITRFGRVPHRNEMLGRETTPEEACFIEEEWLPRRRRVIAGEP